MAKFVVIGERIHCISPVIREAMNTMNPEPILKRAEEQIKAGATYLDLNIGPAESNGEELMKCAPCHSIKKTKYQTQASFRPVSVKTFC